ncbi:MAG TPA: response regulator [Dissulfurispiraceae bacterium]|nr:response regulator [Dissulfurispiraceae bacterium]
MIDSMASTILIIDDDADDMELTVIAIESLRPDVKVQSAYGGREAIDLIHAGHPLPNLILLDLKMPGMNGIDTLSELRRDDRLSRIPVVVVTSSSLESDRSASLDAGANDFMHKAFDMTAFSLEMEAVLSKYL